jgi:hypothetical protein
MAVIYIVKRIVSRVVLSRIQKSDKVCYEVHVNCVLWTDNGTE